MLTCSAVWLQSWTIVFTHHTQFKHSLRFIPEVFLANYFCTWIFIDVFISEHAYERFYPIYQNEWNASSSTGPEAYVEYDAPVNILTGAAGCPEVWFSRVFSSIRVVLGMRPVLAHASLSHVLKPLKNVHSAYLKTLQRTLTCGKIRLCLFRQFASTNMVTREWKPSIPATRGCST